VQFGGKLIGQITEGAKQCCTKLQILRFGFCYSVLFAIGINKLKPSARRIVAVIKFILCGAFIWKLEGTKFCDIQYSTINNE
jgi:hypothetical protein